jgi:hypothetical protein
MKNTSRKIGVNGSSRSIVTGLFFLLMPAFFKLTGIFSCKKTGPAEAMITVLDTNHKSVSGATVILRQDTVVNATTGVKANIYQKKVTDHEGNAFFSFQWEAVLIVEVSHGTLTESDYIRLEQSKTIDKTVILK